MSNIAEHVVKHITDRVEAHFVNVVEGNGHKVSFVQHSCLPNRVNNVIPDEFEILIVIRNLNLLLETLESEVTREVNARIPIERSRECGPSQVTYRSFTLVAVEGAVEGQAYKGVMLRMVVSITHPEQSE